MAYFSETLDKVVAVNVYEAMLGDAMMTRIEGTIWGYANL